MDGLELPPDMENYKVIPDYEEISELLLPKFSGDYRFLVVYTCELNLAVGKKSDDYLDIVNDYFARKKMANNYVD
ncbi:MAG: hypothetical protein KAQ83_03400, partial [Nanoarchaeota archaeon]|nr:hypothetical protein [Nanoarchaeota archaeon]